jgi:hypothetical protein
LEELERIANPRELTLLALALMMLLCGVFVVPEGGTVAVPLIVLGSGMFFVGIFLPVLTEFQIGPGGFSAKLQERDQEVRATLEPHTESLMRTAALLAGTPEAGRELLDRALIETYLRWQQAKSEGPAEAVLKHLGELAPAPTTDASVVEPTDVL